jgi:hypothetical protein
MNPKFIADLVAVLGDVDADEGVKRQIRNGLFRVGRIHGIRDLTRLERHTHAIDLLNKNVSRTTIAARLMSSFGIAKSQAYRDIEEGLRARDFQLSHCVPSKGTSKEENDSIEKQLGIDYDDSSGNETVTQAGQIRTALIQSARVKIAAGGLMTLSEVAALLDLATSTVHALPIESIRIGRSLRFDPQAVTRYIDTCREPAAVQGSFIADLSGCRKIISGLSQPALK